MKMNAGVIIGLIAGGFGALVGIASAFIADPILGVVITISMAAVFYFIYKSVVKPMMNYSRLRKTGTPAKARIVSLSETNTRINNQPLVNLQLEVNYGGSIYTAHTKAVISYFYISQFQPGAEVDVIVDPANKSNVIVLMPGESSPQQVASNPVAMQELEAKLHEMEQENQRIKTIGVYSKAIVTGYTAMGVNVNGQNPLVTLELQVLPSSEPAFSGVVKGVISNQSVALFQPGQEIFVKYDPSDKTRIAIEHS